MSCRLSMMLRAFSHCVLVALRFKAGNSGSFSLTSSAISSNSIAFEAVVRLRISSATSLGNARGDLGLDMSRLLNFLDKFDGLRPHFGGE